MRQKSDKACYDIPKYQYASGGSSVVSYYATSDHEAAIGNSPTVSAGLYTE